MLLPWIFNTLVVLCSVPCYAESSCFQFMASFLECCRRFFFEFLLFVLWTLVGISARSNVQRLINFVVNLEAISLYYIARKSIFSLCLCVFNRNVKTVESNETVWRHHPVFVCDFAQWYIFLNEGFLGRFYGLFKILRVWSDLLRSCCPGNGVFPVAALRNVVKWVRRQWYTGFYPNLERCTGYLQFLGGGSQTVREYCLGKSFYLIS